MPSWRTGKRNLPPKDPGGPPAQYFDPEMFALFRPRPPLEFLPPVVKRKMPPYTGISAFLSHFETTPPPPKVVQETPQKRRERLKAEKLKKYQEETEQKIAAYEDEKKKIQGDAFKTLFVGRIATDVSEKKLRRTFERFGDLENVSMIADREGQFRGYAFVEFKDEKDMRVALKSCNGIKINGKRIVVDVERGRTVRGWKPMRLGGGLGGRRQKKQGDRNGSRFGGAYRSSSYASERRYTSHESRRYEHNSSKSSYSYGRSRNSDGDRYRRRARSRSRSRERRRQDSRRYGDSRRRSRSRERRGRRDY